MRVFLRLAAVLFAILQVWPAAAQNYPSRPVKFIVPFGGNQAVIHRRGPSGRRFDYRDRCRREVGARWLHAAGDVKHAHDQRVSAHQQAVPVDA